MRTDDSNHQLESTGETAVLTQVMRLRRVKT
jgi:hypothetical protein